MRADAGVIHQQRDAGVFAQQILHPRQRGAVAQVGRQHLDRAALRVLMVLANAFSRSRLRATRIRS